MLTLPCKGIFTFWVVVSSLSFLSVLSTCIMVYRYIHNSARSRATLWRAGRRHDRHSLTVEMKMAAEVRWLFVFLVSCGVSLCRGEAPHRKFEYKYSFKPPYLAQKDGSVPFWEYGGSKYFHTALKGRIT